MSEEIIDTVRVYIYCSGDKGNEVLKVELDHMVEYQDGSGEARQPRRNVEETNMKIRGNVKRNMAKYLQTLLEVISGYKYHW